MRRLEWPCDVCGKPIDDGSGYLCLNLDELDAARRSEMASATWRVMHRSCDPQPDADAYLFRIENVRTVAALLDRTAHLVEWKDWLADTDWSALLRRLARCLDDHADWRRAA
jgi:hypothetical protein